MGARGVGLELVSTMEVRQRLERRCRIAGRKIRRGGRGGDDLVTEGVKFGMRRKDCLECRDADTLSESKMFSDGMEA